MKKILLTIVQMIAGIVLFVILMGSASAALNMAALAVCGGVMLGAGWLKEHKISVSVTSVA